MPLGHCITASQHWLVLDNLWTKEPRGLNESVQIEIFACDAGNEPLLSSKLHQITNTLFKRFKIAMLSQG